MTTRVNPVRMPFWRLQLTAGCILATCTPVLAAEGKSAGPSEALFLIQIIVLVIVGRLLGEAMVRINVADLPAPHRLAERGW